MEADDELEDHDENKDRDADVHIECLPGHGDRLRVLCLLPDPERRLVHVALELVEEPLRETRRVKERPLEDVRDDGGEGGRGDAGERASCVFVSSCMFWPRPRIRSTPSPSRASWSSCARMRAYDDRAGKTIGARARNLEFRAPVVRQRATSSA